MPSPGAPITTALTREIFLRSLFMDLPGSVAARLAEVMRDVHVPAGGSVFSPGDPAEHFYYVVEGEVRLDGGEGDPVPFGPRSIVGVMDVMLERARTVHAVATKDALLLKLRAEDWLDQLEENFEFARRSVLALAGGLHTLNLLLAPDGGFPAPTGPPEAPRARPLDLVERITVLRDVPALYGAGVQPLASIAELLEEERFDAGETVFAEGAGQGALRLVVAGEVELTRREPVMRAVFGRGTVIGGSASLGGLLAPYAARALTGASVLRLREEDYFDAMEEHFSLVKAAQQSFLVQRDRLDRLRLARGLSRPKMARASAAPGWRG